MIKLNKFLKVIFHFINLLLILFYLYPGSISGYILYNDLTKQPQVTGDFFYISSNHFYTFSVLGILGIFVYKNCSKIKYFIFYLIFLSIFLELMHLVIPKRSFEFSDLFGNFFGIILTIIIYVLFKKIKKN